MLNKQLKKQVKDLQDQLTAMTESTNEITESLRNRVNTLEDAKSKADREIARLEKWNKLTAWLFAFKRQGKSVGAYKADTQLINVTSFGSYMTEYLPGSIKITIEIS